MAWTGPLGAVLTAVVIATEMVPWVTAKDKGFPYPVVRESITSVVTLHCAIPSHLSEDNDFSPHRLEINTTEGGLAHVVAATPVWVNKTRLHADASVTGHAVHNRWTTWNLTIVTPFSTADTGRYQCFIYYTESGGIDGNETLSLLLDNAFVNDSKKISNDTFLVHSIAAHHVTMTWRSLKDKLNHATLFRTVVDENNNDKSPKFALLTVDGKENLFVYDSGGVQLAKFLAKHENTDNYTLSAYVGREECQRECRYSCEVLYSGCFGENLTHCLYNADGMESTERTKTSTSLWENSTIAVIVICAMLLIALVVFCLWFCRHYRPHKRRKDTLLKEKKQEIAAKDSRLQQKDLEIGRNRTIHGENARLLGDEKRELELQLQTGKEQIDQNMRELENRVNEQRREIERFLSRNDELQTQLGRTQEEVENIKSRSKLLLRDLDELMKRKCQMENYATQLAERGHALAQKAVDPTEDFMLKVRGLGKSVIKLVLDTPSGQDERMIESAENLKGQSDDLREKLTAWLDNVQNTFPERSNETTRTEQCSFEDLIAELRRKTSVFSAVTDTVGELRGRALKLGEWTNELKKEAEKRNEELTGSEKSVKELSGNFTDLEQHRLNFAAKYPGTYDITRLQVGNLTREVGRIEAEVRRMTQENDRSTRETERMKEFMEIKKQNEIEDPNLATKERSETQQTRVASMVKTLEEMRDQVKDVQQRLLADKHDTNRAEVLLSEVLALGEEAKQVEAGLNECTNLLQDEEPELDFSLLDGSSQRSLKMEESVNQLRSEICQITDILGKEADQVDMTKLQRDIADIGQKASDLGEILRDLNGGTESRGQRAEKILQDMGRLFATKKKQHELHKRLEKEVGELELKFAEKKRAVEKLVPHTNKYENTLPLEQIGNSASVSPSDPEEWTNPKTGAVNSKRTGVQSGT